MPSRRIQTTASNYNSAVVVTVHIMTVILHTPEKAVTFCTVTVFWEITKSKSVVSIDVS